MKALMLGSIGVVAETSNLQRKAYNEAFKQAGLDWEWDQELYQELLGFSGGLARLEMLAKATKTELSDDLIKEIHTTKTQVACELVREEVSQARAGVADLIASAKEQGVEVFWVTSTGKENVGAILDACSDLSEDDFKKIYLREDCENGKPSPDIYQKALQDNGLKPEEVLVIEDSLPSILAAKRAGLEVVGFPGEMHQGTLEGVADPVVSDLGELVDSLKGSVAAAA